MRREEQLIREVRQTAEKIREEGETAEKITEERETAEKLGREKQRNGMSLTEGEIAKKLGKREKTELFNCLLLSLLFYLELCEINYVK